MEVRATAEWMPSAPIRMSASNSLDDRCRRDRRKRAVTVRPSARSRDAPAELDRARAQHPLGGAIQDHLQLAAMDGELRPRQAGMAAARISPDGLAVAVGVAQLARLDGGRGQGRLQAEARQDAHGAGLDVDADAERPELAHGLEDLDVETRAMEAHRGGQAPIPAPAMAIFMMAYASRLSPR
jgi:hypothetical protein